MHRLLIHETKSRIKFLVRSRSHAVAGRIIASSACRGFASGRTGTDDGVVDDEATAWVPPKRSVQASGKSDALRHDEEEDDFDFTPGVEFDVDGKVTQFVDLEAMLNSPKMVEKIMQNQDQNEGIIDISEGDIEIENFENIDDDAPDWGWARRKKPSKDYLLDDNVMMTPKDVATARYLDGEIPPIPRTLLTTEEVTSSLVNLGAQDVVVLPVSHSTEMTDFFVIATCFSASNMRLIADTICKSMRLRGLHKMGVIGAEKGCEGRDCDDWIVVDCQNIVIHLQDEFTRKHIALEKLWGESANGASKTDKFLFHVDMNDEDAIDDFIKVNPITDEYAAKFRDENAASINLNKNNFRLRISPTKKSRRKERNKRKKVK
mmetsp:Transcript_27855/g.41113  ORF Transcript_27855/g.41113 Transcript_27855/m.41113 type:complete len:376 (-) Transcript_27855:706-1833(-)|eukprot:CAMPEP_0116021426 /NCGR_PEP_ID=MMETSP0321-20121206/10380_1 /TAXON_ID=163516 /ORGANISM="Leptocylindrus danicus var. danicus, Strain B650" /LENGTH=375 /DNA_ID=CAMNT_0003492295 /DNA_START=1749 /DNA_END=2876 /DNA_ORIENTATION=-